MTKNKFDEIIKNENIKFIQIKIDDEFVTIVQCLQKEQSSSFDVTLSLIDKMMIRVIDKDDEYEYDYIEIQPKILLLCTLCNRSVEENYGKPVKASPENIKNVVKELTSFCKQYATSPIHNHNCFTGKYGLLMAKGFSIS